MVVKLEAKDCSPLKRVKKNVEQPLERDDEQVLKQFSAYSPKEKSNLKDRDDQIVSLRTTRSIENPKEWETKWWAGRYIGYAIIKNKNTNTNTIEISIKPRFGKDFLLTIIEDVYCISFDNDASINNGDSDEWFSELLNVIRYKFWVSKCVAANRYGLPRTNVNREHYGVILKGRIDIHRTLLPWMLKKEVVTKTSEKVLDDSICKIVYEAYRILSKGIQQNKPTKKKKNKDKLSYFSASDTPQTVQDVIKTLESNYKGTLVDVSESDYNRIRYKSIYVMWKPLVDFSWSIIKGKKIGMKESDTQHECVFVDVAEIWEAFLRKKLSEGMSDDGWRVWTVDECKKEIYKDSFFKRHIIPDIVLHRISKKDGKDEFIVFDAKYKRMSVKEGAENGVGNKYDVDRSDFFQIHTYIHYFQHVYPDSRVLLGGLLYPLDEKFNDFQVNNLFGYADGKFDTKFIIDGIVCTNLKTDDNQKTKDEMQARVQEMITRIKNYL